MARDTKVSEVMTTDVLSFTTEQSVHDAMVALVQRGVDAAPVVDAEGRVIGVLSTGDLIVQESQLHFPTVISLLGATIELPSSQRHFEEDLRRALGSTVADVMSSDPVTVRADETVERAATLMHEHHVSRLPVVDDHDRLVGIISRGDILRVILQDQ